MLDLKKGAVFRAFHKGGPTNPITQEELGEDQSQAGVWISDAVRNTLEGYGVECVWGKYPDIIKELAS